jgi:Ras GTPase-activating-like protein IQGAP2/3
LAEKIGNLVGKIDFTDEELHKKQKGLDAAGVAMPSFGNIGRQLAKEINEEPEPEQEPEETEQESQ